MSFASYLLDTSKLQPSNPKLQGMIGNVVDVAVKENFKASPRNLGREDVRSGKWGLPPQDTYASRWSSGTNSYYYYFDEAIRNSTANALAMRRDPTLMEPLRHRQMAIVSQNWYLKSDDPDDMDQQKVCDELTSVLENTSMLKGFIMNLLDDIYFGKAGVQCRFGYESVKGKERLCVIDHAPVMGDKIQYKFGDAGTPGILIYSASPLFNEPEYKKHIGRATLGLALFLEEPWLRDRFVISKFMTSDFDYIWEGDKALAVHGIGMRDSIYWAWNLRTEILTWITDAIQRIGANGMTIGFFEYGNPKAEEAVTNLIKTLVKDSYAVCGVDAGTENPQNMIHNIPVTPAGYEIMIELVRYLDDFIRRAFLGQELTSTTRSAGMGAATADVQKSSFDHIVGFDSDRIAETISKQLIKVLLKYNTWDYKGQKITGDRLPFAIRFIFEDRDDEDEKPADTAKTLHEIGVPLDIEDIRDKTGFEAPIDKKSVLPGKNDQEIPGGAAPPQVASQGNGAPPNGKPQQMAYGNRIRDPLQMRNGHPIDQMEMFNGPPDEKRDDSGKWTIGGGSVATKEVNPSKIEDKSSTTHKKGAQGRKITNAGIEIDDSDGVDESMKSIFGRTFSEEYIASCSGAPDDSHVSIDSIITRDGDHRIDMNWSSDYGYGHREIYRDQEKIVIDNHELIIDKSHQGKGIGADVFGLQVNAASLLGINEIRTVGAREDKAGLIGYKVWPMLGYDGDLPFSVGKGLNGETRISELMRTPEGRDWWNKNGKSIDLEFDLSPDSYSMKTWQAYQARKKS